jgi:hypothetical protein
MSKYGQIKVHSTPDGRVRVDVYIGEKVHSTMLTYDPKDDYSTDASLVAVSGIDGDVLLAWLRRAATALE